MSRRILTGLLAVLPALGEKCGVEITAPFSDTTVSRADAPAPPPVDLFVHVVAGSESRLDGYLTVWTNLVSLTWVVTLGG
jgi:hypothetical protein